MKTTIDIADSILAQSKRLAAKRKTTLRAVVESALRDAIEGDLEAHRQPAEPVHTFRGRGLQPGLAWDDWSALRQLAYEDRGG